MRPRIIPGFQISKGELVHIIEFNKNSKRYIGDPLNTLRIFNQKSFFRYLTEVE